MGVAATLGETIIAIIIVLVVIAALDSEKNPEYYQQCTAGGKSELVCFYDHVLKL